MLSYFYRVIPARVFLFVILVWGSYNLFAQNPPFRNISFDNGLPSSTIFKSAEDSLGYIWMAGIEGVLRYDGTSFHQYGAADGLTEKSFYFVACLPGSNTLLFISNSFQLFVYQHGRFIHVQSEQPIAWITFDGHNKPYAMTRRGDIFTLENDRLLLYSASHEKQAVYYHLTWVDRRSFMISNTSGIEYVHESGRRESVLNEQDSEREHRTSRVFKLSNGRIFICNVNGIHEFDRRKFSLNLLFPFENNEVYCAGTYKNDILFGCNNGLLSFSNGIINHSHLKNLIPNTQLFDMFKTSEERYIFSTNTDGLYFSMLSSSFFGKNEGLENSNIRYIENQGKDVYAFSNRADIYRLNNGRFKAFKPGAFLYKPNTVRFTCTDKDGLLVGLKINTNTMMRIDKGKAHAVVKGADIPWLIAHVDDSAVYFDNGYNKEKNIRIKHRFLASIAPHAKFNRASATSSYLLLIDRKRNRYYYGKDKGYIQQDLNLSPDSFVSENLGSDVEMMIKVNDTTIAAGTLDKGLALIYDHSVVFLNAGNGLSGNHCMKIVKDGNELWVMTEKGLSRVKLTNNIDVRDICNFNSNNVLADDVVNDFCVTGNTVYVAGKQGVIAFGRNLSLKHNLPKVNISGLSINNIDTVVNTAYELPYDMNNITVTYKYPSLLSAAKSSYKYMLIRGKDTLVNNVTSDEKLQLFSLASGKYSLFLFAMAADGKWSRYPSVIRLHIHPVFWKTWWFISIVSLVLFGFITGVFMYRIKVNKKASLMQNRLIDSELKALRLHMNPHFIFNTLNSLQRYILKYDPLTANKYIAKLSQLMRWVMEYSDKQQISLQEEMDFLDLYIKLEQLRFEKAFIYKLEMASLVDVHDTFIPALVIQPFVENAIKYGLSGKTDGLLQISLKREHNLIVVYITDNGAGREQVKREQMESGRTTVSTGIRYTEERLRLIAANKHITPVIITDLYEKDRATGTRVELLIPILT
jgi:hypothetical protein